MYVFRTATNGLNTLWAETNGRPFSFLVKGRKTRSDSEGEWGDIRARPVALGQGDYTATYGRYDFEFEDGTPVTGGR